MQRPCVVGDFIRATGRTQRSLLPPFSVSLKVNFCFVYRESEDRQTDHGRLSFRQLAVLPRVLACVWLEANVGWDMSITFFLGQGCQFLCLV
jgi:hypothetical protein